jgi:hypothetical protein
MNPCTYCGRQNADSAFRCTGCGTELGGASNGEQSATKSGLCSPGGWVCLIAAIVVLQGWVRLGFTPHDPSLGEGDYKRVEAALYFWLSLGIGLVLFAYGVHLVRKRANEKG